MKKKIITLLSVGFFITANSQIELIPEKSKSNSLGIQIGHIKSYNRDLNFSPLNNIGQGYNLGLSYNLETKKKHILFVNIDYSESILKSRASPFFIYNRYLLNSELGFLFHKPTNNTKLTLNFGVSYQNSLDLLDYKNFKSLSFFNFHGIAVNSLVKYRLNSKHSLGSNISLFTIGYLTRPPYTGWNKFMIENEDHLLRIMYRGKVNSINNLFNINTKLFYNYNFSKKINISIQYELRYKKTQQNKAVLTADNLTSIKLIFKF